MDDSACTKHSGLVADLKNLKEDLMEERTRRERAFTVLSSDLKSVTGELTQIKTTIAKWSGIAIVVIFIVQAALQIAMKLIPTSG